MRNRGIQSIVGMGALVIGLGCTGEINSSGPAEEDPPPDETPNPNAQPPAEGPATIQSVLNGSFAALPGFSGIDGRVQMTRFLDGTTQVDLVATGLAASLPHNAHVHALPCSYLGGGHYKMDPAIVDALDTNEIWPNFISDEAGIGRASVSALHLARGDAMSVVIHDPVGGGKMACADLVADDAGVFTAAGTIAPLPGVAVLDETIGGSAVMTTTGISTKLDMSITGLDPASSYVSHVHALPCEVQTGGGHYMIDPTAVLIDPVALEANELWPVIGAHDLGSATVALTKAHNVRYDAQSVVIHRIDGDLKPKVACANLVRASWPAGITGGSAVLLDAGTERLANLTATAEMTRRLDGVTVVSMSAIGLEKDTTYAVHVHNLPCGVSSGGGHYLLDSTVADTVQSNEIWLRLTAGADSAAEATTYANHLARSEASSLVIHDPADGSRLACIDLQ